MPRSQRDPLRTRRRVASFINRFLKRFGVRIEADPERQWERDFERWRRAASASGVDINDVGDREWGTDLLDRGLREIYLPAVSIDDTVLELGPGSGRLSRHLIGRCHLLLAADASKRTCTYLQRYLEGRGSFRIHHVPDGQLRGVADQSVDAVVSHGVFEHLDLDEIYWILVDIARVVRPGAPVCFSYNTTLSEEAEALLRTHSGPGRRCIFRLHDPRAIESVSRMAGFSEVDSVSTGTRIAFARLRR
jgi:SAM-dependent methyltransferase